MEIDGAGVFLFLTQPAFYTGLRHQKPLVLQLWRFKKLLHHHHSFHSHRHNHILGSNSYVGIISTTTTARSSRWDNNAEPSGPRRFKFKFRDKNKGDTGNDDVEGGDEEEGGGGVSSRKGKKRKWLSDEPPFMMEDEEEVGIFEEVIDGLWILKALKSYGWTLPPIMISLLLATGPKAFFTVFAISIGQSALVFAFEKLFGRTQRKPKRKARRRKSPSSRTSRYAAVDDEEEGDGEKQERVKEKMGYQSWIANENGSVSKDSQNGPALGGWDELDGVGSVPRPSQTSGWHRRTPSANGKLGKRGRKSDTPLLLRLLIAVFPFLGSWTKML